MTALGKPIDRPPPVVRILPEFLGVGFQSFLANARRIGYVIGMGQYLPFSLKEGLSMRRAIHLLGFSILTPLFILSTTLRSKPDG